MKKLAIVALIYLEDDWQQTVDCLNQVKDTYDIFYADRDGVGNMSRAFNEAFRKNVKGQYEYVWFVTNITFEPTAPVFLSMVMDKGNLDALHPAMASSDHPHLHPNGDTGCVVSVPFIELTAAMFKCSVFEKFMLCEQTPYYYMDLVISHQIKEQGGRVAVYHGVQVNHTYLRNKKSTHPISKIRAMLRNYHTPISKDYMVNRFGTDWVEKLWKR